MVIVPFHGGCVDNVRIQYSCKTFSVQSPQAVVDLEGAQHPPPSFSSQIYKTLITYKDKTPDLAPKIVEHFGY